MQKIPFMNLAAQYEKINPEIQQAINNVLESTKFIMGPDVGLFEREYAAFCRAQYCIGVGNGTDALTLALRALGVTEGDRVITVPNTFIATTEAITLAGGNVEFVDINPNTFLIDPNKLETRVKYLRKKNIPLKAVIAVHLYGQSCDMDSINDIAKRYDLNVIEDAAQAHGSEYKGSSVGALSNAACFSFYPGKNLGAYGDAGAIVTNDQKVAEKVAMLRNHGRTKKYEHDMEGLNSRLDTLQAAILRVKLKYLESWTAQRIDNASYYTNKLTENMPYVTVPKVTKMNKHVFHLYVIRHNNRDKLTKYLSEVGISTGIHYPLPLHLQPAYKHLGYKTGDFPISEQACKEIISLPIDAEISFSQIDYVCQAINSSIEFI
jgi:dTDP-4-amino-4,6-dideoxygalactose transaminase